MSGPREVTFTVHSVDADLLDVSTASGTAWALGRNTIAAVGDGGWRIEFKSTRRMTVGDTFTGVFYFEDDES
jgi:hypothetical protein